MQSKDFPGNGKKVGIISVPLGYGAGQKGSELGATAILLSDIRGSLLTERIKELGYEVKDYGDAEIVKPKYVAKTEENPKYLKEMLASCENISASLKQILQDGAIPVILGGDHSIAIGTFSAISSFFKARGEEIGLIWFDAHADINTPETSSSGNLHGMPLAALLGYGEPSLVNLEEFAPKLESKFCAHVGARDLDAGEQRRICELGMRDNFFTMSDIDRRGMLACVEDAINIASQASGGYAVTFDVDMIDPRFAPGSGTLVRGGTTYREAHLALEVIAERGGMRSFEIVEVNPMLDKSNITVELAGELILSALGKTIL
ncbi:MAG: arginase [Acidobacteria bacterium]|jgi:arginase|nr:arginase [Acidobacteriota bacterium]